MRRNLRLRDSGIELTRSWRGALPAGGRDAFRQFAILVACYAVYDVARVLVRGREAVAMSNALAIMNAEKALHLYVEPFVQTIASHVHPVVLFMDWFYTSVHIPATILVLVWIYLYRNEAYGFFRNVFLTMNVLGITIFAMLPVAPPRLVPTSGVVDTLYLYSSSNYRSGAMSFVTNQFAALPSLHIGYALFLTLAIWVLTTNRLARALAAVYPVLVLAAIVITGNHYLIDALAGVLVLGVAFVANYGGARQVVPEPVTVSTRRRDE